MTNIRTRSAQAANRGRHGNNPRDSNGPASKNFKSFNRFEGQIAYKGKSQKVQKALLKQYRAAASAP